MDSIERARKAMKEAEEDYLDSIEPGSGHAEAEQDELRQELDEAEQAYYRACETWEPRDCSGVIGAGGLVYSDADPGL